MTTTVAIVGAGFTGTMLSIHLAEHLKVGDRILLFERAATFARGVAYATGDADHLLNVRAANMSAWPDRPDHFATWLAARQGVGADGAGRRFASRAVFGSYLQEQLRDVLSRCPTGRLSLVGSALVDARPGAAGGFVLTTELGRTYRADRLVLAMGNALERPEFGNRMIRNPWSEDALDGLDPGDSVVLLGTGLTMVDVVVSLLARGHAGRIVAVSRRGLLPHRHRDAEPAPVPEPLPPGPPGVVGLLRHMRRLARSGACEWRDVVDSLRPHTQAVWRAWSLTEKRRFLRHARPWWDIHRHRMAPQVADRIDRAIAGGQLAIHAARIGEVMPAEDGHTLFVTVRARGADADRTFAAERVIDCTGLRTDWRTASDPLLRSLLDRELVRPDPLGLGLDVAEDLRVLGGDGRLSPSIWAAGPLTRGAFWEVVAVPDIRRQCAELARRLASDLIAEPT